MNRTLKDSLYLKGFKKNRLLTTLLLISIFCCLVFFREVNLFLEPRFWAEEATVYFKSAYELTGFQNFLTPHLGYYSFFNKLSSYLSILVPLKLAPAVTTVMSVLPILFVYYLSINTRNSLLKTTSQRVLFAILIILISSGEIWLNTITSQFWLAVSVLLLLLDRTKWVGNKRIFNCILVFASAVTGVISLFLIPLAMGLIWLEGNIRRNVRHVLYILLFGLLIQLILIVNFGFNFGQGDVAQIQGGERFASFDYLSFLKGLVGYYFLYPFTGIGLYDYSINAYLLYSIIVTFVFVYLFISGLNARNSLFAMYSILISVITIFLSVGGGGGLRYAFLVNALVLMLLISFLNTKFLIKIFLTRMLLLSVCFIAVLEYRYKLNDFYQKDWITWSEQINTNLTEDNAYKVWPQFPYSWEFKLKRKDSE